VDRDAVSHITIRATFLALALLVAGIARTDHPYRTVTANNFAVTANLLDWSTYLHCVL